MGLEAIAAIKSALSRVEPSITLPAPRRLPFFGAMANGLPGHHPELLEIYLDFRETHHNDLKSRSEYEKEFEAYAETSDRHFNTIFKILRDELKVELTQQEKEVIASVGESSGEKAKKVAKTPLDEYKALLLDLNDPEGSRCYDNYRGSIDLPTPNMDPTLKHYFVKKGLNQIAGKAFEVGNKTVVPLSDLITQDLHKEAIYNHQTIPEDGVKKRCIEGLIQKGLVYFVPNREAVYAASAVGICEGAATAESVYLSTEIPQIAAINGCNLPLSAISLIEFGSAENILYMADTKAKGYLDLDKMVNTLRAGIKAKGSNCLIGYAVPEIKGENQDFNDLLVAECSSVVGWEVRKAFAGLSSVSNESILDDDTNQYNKVDLAKHLPEKHNLRLLSKSISDATHIPQSTVILVGLGVFSSIACRAVRVGYERKGTLPISLYVVVEQPSGANKSRCVNEFTAPFQQAHKAHIDKNRTLLRNAKSVEKPEKEAVEFLENQLKVPLFTTNATPEGLESTLPYSNGSFAVVSAEQGAFNSLLGLSYGDGRASNNDLVLLGFNGDFMSSVRVTRDAFVGFVCGGITVFAQPQSVDKILNQSNGTGLSERFLMLAEPHALGSRNFLETSHIDEVYTEEYKKVCAEFASAVLHSPKSFTSLPILTLDSNGWLLIKSYRNKIEPELRDGGKLSHSALRGAASKIDMQIMKIAVNLHLLTGFDLSINVPNELVTAAIGIANDLLFSQVEMLKDKGVMGVKAEWQAVISYLSKRGKGAVVTDIINSLRNTKPFKDTSGNKSALIKTTVSDMVVAHKLVEKDGVYSVN